MYRTSFDEDKKEWSGPMTETVFNPNTSVGNVLLNVLEVNGSRIAQICADTNLATTFAELRDVTICVAKNLQNLGCQKGEVIFFLTNNTVDVPALVFAALCLGCPVSFLPTCCTKREYQYYLAIKLPNYVICDAEYYAMLNECFRNLGNNPIFFIFGDQMINNTRPTAILFQQFDSGSDLVAPEMDGTKEIAFITRSSGTTGMPKGVCISHAYILDNVRRLSPFTKATDILLGFNSFDGISGIRMAMSAILNGATRIVNTGPFSPERFFYLVERFKVTFTASTAFSVIQLLNHPQIEFANLSSLKHYICAGSKLSLDAINEMNKYLKGGKLCHGYGMTEFVGPVAVNFNHTRNDCVGQLISGCKVKIVNEHGHRLGINEDGELCIKPSFLFSSYLTDNQCSPNYLDREGFFITGDIARFDKNGDLFMIDRKKEQFKCCGYHVSPTELEQFLDKISGVKQSCVVPIPDIKSEFLPAALIVKTENSTCTEESIYNAVLNTFAQYKRLRGGIYFIDALPMTRTGKIARNIVAQNVIELHKSRNSST